MEPRSNKLFYARGLAKKIQYQIQLSTSRNPDFIVRHPNETKEKNSANWKMEITKRVKHEQELRLKALVIRMDKVTSYRRMNEQ